MLVQTQQFTFDRIDLECGESLSEVQIAYQTYGVLNDTRSNAILICHALTGDAHAAGKYNPDSPKPGWWDKFIGPGRAIDTERYFVICSNVIGGCGGSTGPASLNPGTGRPYALSFPFITIKDMVRVQYRLLTEKLGLKGLHSVIGGSMGGMQALEWAISYPEMCASYMILASAPYQSPQNIALHEVGRRAIMIDPNWHKGDYYDKSPPNDGLSVARMIAHITYLSDQTMHQKFGRRIQGKEELNFELCTEFEVESYLDYQGRSFIKRFDANSYLYITRAVDYFDYSGDKLRLSLRLPSDAHFMVVSFESDWLYPHYQSREILKALKWHKLPITYSQVNSSYGHDAFLLETDRLTPIMAGFLGSI
ncbi:MAG: homoserine O-acetyltransferase [Candidatus Caenarcaniphilales bacterium]|nr:homoserine O-acetyltransferase [Candidatus Caenarcaniphilales bacterium]